MSFRLPRPRAALALAIVGVVMVGLSRAPAVGADTVEDHTPCREVTVPVSTASGQPPEYQIWGRLCVPEGRSASTVQVLLHGLNYSHVYWDFPYRNSRYSYVSRAHQAGYATFNLDRLGVGHSSHPPSGQVTLHSNALAVAQVVAALRAGAVGSRPFAKVILTEAIDVPVLFVVGDHDRLVCAADAGNDCSSSAGLAAGERPFYPAAPRVEALVLDDVGHAINLHRAAPGAFAKVLSWAARSL